MHALLGLGTVTDLLSHPVVGGSWEGWIIENLIASAPAQTHASFYRTAVGAEIDLLLEIPGGIEHVPLLELMRELLALHRVPV